MDRVSIGVLSRVMEMVRWKLIMKGSFKVIRGMGKELRLFKTNRPIKPSWNTQEISKKINAVAL
jgi:hypothetical protein